MKTLPRIFALVTVSTFAFASALLRAQDGPPPPDQGAPPPDQNDQGAPPPDQGPAPQDQGGDQDDQGASFQTFYDQLGDQGQWVQTDDYGYVFQPNVSDPNWAPYTDGHWVYTDVGWTWVSEEPWGWATYHYGRWCNIDGTGWCWVPGYRWAPAWVSWRYGGGYCGWAPLPPETFVGAEYGRPGVRVGIGFHFGNDVDVNFNIGPGCYNFVRVGDFGERNYRGHYIDRNRNYTVINNTTNITNININRGGGFENGRGRDFRGVSNGGPAFADINSHSRQHVQQVQLTQANQAGRSTLNGDSLAVFAPRMNPGSEHTARPTRVGQTIDHPAFNRGDSITKPLDVTSTLRPAAPSQEAIAAAHEARQKEPASAHIANENTAVKTPITTPLTSMQPVEQREHHQGNAAAPGLNNAAGPNAVTPHTDATFTGETQKPVTHPQTEIAPRTETGNSAFTGEQQKPVAHTENTPVTHTQPVENPTPTFYPQTQQQPAQAYHPQAETSPVTHTQPVENPTPTLHPQTQQQPTQTYHPQAETAPVTHTQPASTYHPKTETPGHDGQVYHNQNQSEFRPSQQPESQPSFHPQNQGNGGSQPSYHPQQQAAPTFHQQEAPVVHTQVAPQPQHESAPAPQQHTQAAPAAAHSAPSGAGQGGGSSGNKKSDGEGKGPATPQGH